MSVNSEVKRLCGEIDKLEKVDGMTPYNRLQVLTQIKLYIDRKLEGQDAGGREET